MTEEEIKKLHSELAEWKRRSELDKQQSEQAVSDAGKALFERDAAIREKDETRDLIRLREQERDEALAACAALRWAVVGLLPTRESDQCYYCWLGSKPNEHLMHFDADNVWHGDQMCLQHEYYKKARAALQSDAGRLYLEALPERDAAIRERDKERTAKLDHARWNEKLISERDEWKKRAEEFAPSLAQASELSRCLARELLHRETLEKKIKALQRERDEAEEEADVFHKTADHCSDRLERYEKLIKAALEYYDQDASTDWSTEARKKTSEAYWNFQKAIEEYRKIK